METVHPKIFNGKEFMVRELGKYFEKMSIGVLKSKTFEEVQELYKQAQNRMLDFIPMESKEEEERFRKSKRERYKIAF